MEEEKVLKFVLDVHLGKLARYLRLCGFDSIFSNDYDDREIMDLSNSENRIILTCDKLLLENKRASKGYLVKSQKPEEQLKEVFTRFDLKKAVLPFTRCMECNLLLKPVEKEIISGRLEPRTLLFYNEFRICTLCDRVYWKGSHFEKMKNFVAKISGLKVISD